MSVWTTPKTDWGAPPAIEPITDVDFNRIEGNTLYLKDQDLVINGRISNETMRVTNLMLDDNEEVTVDGGADYNGVIFSLYAYRYPAGGVGATHSSKITGQILGLQSTATIYSITTSNNAELWTASSGSRVRVVTTDNGDGSWSYTIKNLTGVNALQIVTVTQTI